MNNKSILHILCGTLVFSSVSYMHAMQAPKPNPAPINLSYKQAIFSSFAILGTIFISKAILDRYMMYKYPELSKASLLKLRGDVQNQNHNMMSKMNDLDTEIHRTIRNWNAQAHRNR